MPPSYSAARRNSRKFKSDSNQRTIADFFGPRAKPPKLKAAAASNRNKTIAFSFRPGSDSGGAGLKAISNKSDKSRRKPSIRDTAKTATSSVGERSGARKEVEKRNEEEKDVDMESTDAFGQNDPVERGEEREGTVTKGTGENVQTGSEVLNCNPDVYQQSRSISPAKRRRGAAESAPEAKRLVSNGVIGESCFLNENTTPPGLKREDISDDSDDDSFADLREYEKSLALSGVAGLRKSSRITKEVIRFDPNAPVMSSARGGSVFGGSAFQMKKESKSAVNALKAMVQERSAREAEEKQIEEMKQDLINCAEVLTEGEAEIRDAANEEDRLDRQRLARLDKYALPIPLFVNFFEIPSLNPKYLQRRPGEVQVDPVHDIFLEAWQTRDETSHTFLPLAKFVDQVCLGNFGIDLSNTAILLFKLVMFDETPMKPGASVDRDHLFNSLCNMIRCNVLDTGPARLETLKAVLERYGAVFSKCTRASTASRAVHDSSLEALAKAEGKKSSNGTVAKATRNLRRMLIFSAERIRHGDKLHRVVSRGVTSSARSEAIVHSLKLCIQILLSEYGCRLHSEVGSVITALLERVPSENWPEFRISAAKCILAQTTRLGLHADLVTSLLPYTTMRAQSLRLDTAYLSLLQWFQGPGPDPQWNDIQSFHPSEAARLAGIEEVSYCVADIIQILQKVPELQKSTDDEWACRLSKVIRQAITDQRILVRRTKGEVGVLHQLIQKLRTCSHRMVFGVPVQDMRLALDAALVAVRELLRNSQSAQAEILPHAKSEMTQTLLTRPIA